jgi:hypothetical protein
MKPGRELDRSIAESVMGFKNVHENDSYIDEPGTEFIGGMYISALVYQPCDDIPGYFLEVPKYSTDMDASWEVVEVLKNKGFTVDLSAYPIDREWLEPPYEGAKSKEWVLKRTNIFYQCRISEYDASCGGWIHVIDQSGDTPSYTICLAALSFLDYKALD